MVRSAQARQYERTGFFIGAAHRVAEPPQPGSSATLVPGSNGLLNRGTKSHSITASKKVNDKIRRPDPAYLVRVSGFLRLPFRTKQPCSVQRLCPIQGSGSAERLS